MENERRVAAGALLDLVRAIFETCGMHDGDAHLLADSLVDADLSGVHSHGVLRVPEYVSKLTVDGVDPNGKPEVVKDNGACLVVDGGNSMGQIGTAFAMEQVIARARDIGIAAAGIRGSNHCGAVGYFARMASGLRYDWGCDDQCSADNGSVGRCRAHPGYQSPECGDSRWWGISHCF